MALLVPALVLVAGCGGSDDAAPSDAASAAASLVPTATTSPTGPAWNPCSGLRAGPVSKALGHDVRVEPGTADDVRCSLLPVEKGDPTFNVTYVWTGASLEETFGAMTLDDGVDILTPDVPGADDARLVVNESPADGAVTLTGFVETGDLVETVNGLALAPYDTEAMEAAMTVVLTQLSASAPAAP